MAEAAPARSGPLRVATATTPEEREAVYRLRYRVFIDEMGWQRAPDADHERKIKTDDLDAVASIYYLTDGTDVVAAVRTIRAADVGHYHYAEAYGLDRFADLPPEAIQFTSALVVAPEWRGTRALGQLLTFVYEQGRQTPVWLGFIHCAPSLVALYEALGYRRFQSDVMESDTGLRIPLVLVVDDIDYLTRVRSPFARLATRFPSDPEHGRWFATRFAEYAQPSCSRLMGSDEFWAYLTSQIHVEDHPLLRGLSDTDTRRILRDGTILRIPRGQRVVRAGDAGPDMFMLLSGVAEVRAAQMKPGGVPYVLETLGTGQIFGEMSFLSGRPRTADVVALSDLELLSLNRTFLDRLTESIPTAASRLLLNLSVYLVDRLQNTTRTLADVAGADAAATPTA